MPMYTWSHGVSHVKQSSQVSSLVSRWPLTSTVVSARVVEDTFILKPKSIFNFARAWSNAVAQLARKALNTQLPKKIREWTRTKTISKGLPIYHLHVCIALEKLLKLRMTIAWLAPSKLCRAKGFVFTQNQRRINRHEKAAVCMLALGLKLVVETFHQNVEQQIEAERGEEESSAVFSETTQLPRSNPALVAFFSPSGAVELAELASSIPWQDRPTVWSATKVSEEMLHIEILTAKMIHDTYRKAL